MSAAQPWMKFYPRDWRGDQALRVVSLAARGLWIECLSIMHEATPYGHLVVNGKPLEDGTLARLVGTSEEEVRALKAELTEAGVANQTRVGVLVSRRMVRDENRAKKGRKAVRKRWSQPHEKLEENGTPNRSPTQTPITQKPEARSQREAKASPLREEPAVATPPDVLRVMKAAGMTRPPSDADRLRQWTRLGARIEDHVLPVAERIGAREAERGRVISTFKYLEAAVLEAVDEERRETERHREASDRIRQAAAAG